MNLDELKLKLAKELPEYEFTKKKQFGRECIIIKKDTYRGAGIVMNEDRFQIIPMIPTIKGKMIFGSGINWAEYFIKNYTVVVDKVYSHLIKQEPSLKIAKIDKIGQLEQTKKEQKTDGYIILILGIFLIGLGVFLFYELKALEINGGELSINYIIVVIYENLGKEGVAGALGILGAFCIYNGIKKLKD